MYDRVKPAIKAGGFIFFLFIVSILISIPILGAYALMGGDSDLIWAEDASTIEAALTSSFALFVAVLCTARIFKFSKNWAFSWSEVGIVKHKILSNLIKGIGIGILLILLSVLPLIAFDAISITANNLAFADLAGYLLVFCLVAIGEELLIRGYILSYLVKYYPRVFAVLISAIIFSLLHIFNGNFNLLECFNLILVGIFLAALKFRYQNLWVPVGTHFSWNFMQGSVLGFPVSGIDVPSIYLISFEENTIFNGGLFGIEGSILSTVVFIALVIYLRNTLVISEQNHG